MKCNNGVSPVIGTAQELGELGLGHALGHLGDFRRGLGERLFALFVLRDVEEEACLFEV